MYVCTISLSSYLNTSSCTLTGKVPQRLSPVPRRIGSRAWILPMSLSAPAVDHKLSRLAARPKRRPVLILAMCLFLQPCLRDAVKWQ